MAIRQDGEVELFSRNGNSFTARFPEIIDALLKARPKRFILDGEIVALDQQGRHSFALLQKIQSSKAAVHFYLFDLLHLDNENLMRRPLSQRRDRMEDAFRNLVKPLDLSPILPGSAAKVLQHVRALNLKESWPNRQILFIYQGKRQAPGRNIRRSAATTF